MHLLLYCIFLRSSGRSTDGLRGVDRQPVLEVSNGHLSAAVSEVDRISALQEVPQILIYESVISTLHKKHSLIPMRFGCLLDDPATVTRLLHERDADFQRILVEISGCEELGIHVLLGRCPKNDGEHPESPVSRIAPAPVSLAEGREYLASRRRHYDSIDEEGLKRQHLLDRFRSDLSGLFLQCRVDEHRSPIPLLPSYMRLVSFRFLVHRTLFEEFIAMAESSLLQIEEWSFLGGPCPPYSFVSV